MFSTKKQKTETTELEDYFNQFRKHIIGINQEFTTPFGDQKIVYSDWTASGRLYRPIEEKMMNEFGPFVGNTHTETTVSGTAMTKAYQKAKDIIKAHVNCNDDDVLIIAGNGMTGVVNKFQRILGLKIPENIRKFVNIPDEVKPVVFISHMEHHSNQTSWLETMAEVVIVPPCPKGLFCLDNLEKSIDKYKDTPLKIVSVTACSNVTGLQNPIHKIAKVIHKHGGVCFVDYACSAPYVDINMHPKDESESLDAIYFSPHKFLGGPGTSGILLFNKKLYHNMIPDCPGGGTVAFTNPWGEHKYFDNIEDREDGGTPGFLQTIKSALAIQLKEQMNTEKIIAREHEIMEKLFNVFTQISNLNILAGQHKDRLGVISFYIEDLHYNLGVKLLNDRFGIQTRGGCSCAGTYGHYLLHVDYNTSHELTDEIGLGDLSRKPGWIRLSIHPTLTNDEIDNICKGVKALAENHGQWAKEYVYDKNTNEFTHKSELNNSSTIDNWFKL